MLHAAGDDGAATVVVSPILDHRAGGIGSKYDAQPAIVRSGVTIRGELKTQVTLLADSELVAGIAEMA